MQLARDDHATAIVQTEQLAHLRHYILHGLKERTNRTSRSLGLSLLFELTGKHLHFARLTNKGTHRAKVFRVEHLPPVGSRVDVFLPRTAVDEGVEASDVVLFVTVPEGDGGRVGWGAVGRCQSYLLLVGEDLCI